MSEIAARHLLKTPTVTITDVCCQGSCRGRSPEECTATTQLVFPYRGVYVRHLGSDPTVAEANQVLFFNATEAYRVSHPVPGGDASLTLIIQEEYLREMAPRWRFVNSVFALILAPRCLSRSCGTVCFRELPSPWKPRASP